MAGFAVYKRGQGKYTRIGTFVGVMIVAITGAGALSAKLAGYAATREPVIRFGIPTLLAVAVAMLVFWIVNRAKSADFMIATEGEMKKVSWSSKKEITGSTKVVIVTTFMTAGLLFGVDMMFQFLFRWLKILR